MQFSKGNEKLGSGCLGEEAKAEEAKILEVYPEIGILHSENCGFLRTAYQRVYYVYLAHGSCQRDRDYFQNTDLSALVETIRNWSKRQEGKTMVQEL